ncbi:MAG: hypothetical protein HOH95_02530 [Dehalococcoidia bacterium]|jgi:uncharacterized cupredoxin-like copper-binding protein|nr:hypothetical protein [Dehalococcoidia bacterium]
MIGHISKFAVVGALILGSVVLAACGGDEGPGTVTRLGTPPVEADPVGSATVVMASGETAQEIAVVLDEWSIAPELAEMDAGVVEFVVTNEGAEPHELVVIRNDAEPSALPVVDGLVPEGDVDFRGEVEEFPAGSIRVGTFRLEAGRYLLICNIPQHYQQGMVTEFVVR